MFTVEQFLSRGAFIRLKNDQWVLAWGKFSKNTALSRGDRGFYCQDFTLKREQPWLKFSNYLFVNTKEFINLNVLEEKGGAKLERSWQEESFSEFADIFSEIKSAIAHRGLKKAVPVTWETSEGALTKAEKQQFLQNCIDLPSEIYPYGFWSEERGFIGLTPERLFESKSDQKFETIALAGTKDSQDLRSLLEDPKESKEHQLVVEQIREKLSPLAGVDVQPTKEWCIGPLTHLRTDISGSLKEDVSFEHLVHTLHPTPALGVYPQQPHWEWFKKSISPQDRGVFGAPFGFRDRDGSGLCLVAIRNLIWDKTKTRLYSGCGVVEESQLEREWAELKAKRNSVKRFLEQ